MRVLHFLHYAQGGIVTVVFELIRHSQDFSLDYHVAFLERSPALEQLARDMGIKVHYVEGTFPSAVARSLRLLRALNPSVVHAHSYVPRICAATAIRLGWWEGSCVNTFHNDYPHLRDSGPKSRLKRYTERLALRALPGPVVACSESVRTAVQRAYDLPRARLRTIHNGITPPVVEGSGAGVAGPVAVTVGRVSAQKNYLGLLESWREVAPQLPSAQLWIIGDGDERPLLEERISTYGLGNSVKLLGWLSRNEVATRVRQAQLFVMCSRYEGLPTAAIEAQMLGVPVLTTPVAGIEDIVSDGVTGRILGGRAELGSSLVSLLNDPEGCRRWGEQARVAAKQRFGVERYVREIEGLYRGLEAAPQSAHSE